MNSTNYLDEVKEIRPKDEIFKDILYDYIRKESSDIFAGDYNYIEFIDSFGHHMIENFEKSLVRRYFDNEQNEKCESKIIKKIKLNGDGKDYFIILKFEPKYDTSDKYKILIKDEIKKRASNGINSSEIEVMGYIDKKIKSGIYDIIDDFENSNASSSLEEIKIVKVSNKKQNTIAIYKPSVKKWEKKNLKKFEYESESIGDIFSVIECLGLFQKTMKIEEKREFDVDIMNLNNKIYQYDEQKKQFNGYAVGAVLSKRDNGWIGKKVTDGLRDVFEKAFGSVFLKTWNILINNGFEMNYSNEDEDIVSVEKIDVNDKLFGYIFLVPEETFGFTVTCRIIDDKYIVSIEVGNEDKVLLLSKLKNLLDGRYSSESIIFSAENGRLNGVSIGINNMEKVKMMNKILSILHDISNKKDYEINLDQNKM